jgi:hypothetical protein
MQVPDDDPFCVRSRLPDNVAHLPSSLPRRPITAQTFVFNDSMPRAMNWSTHLGITRHSFIVVSVLVTIRSDGGQHKLQLPHVNV